MAWIAWYTPGEGATDVAEGAVGEDATEEPRYGSRPRTCPAAWLLKAGAMTICPSGKTRSFLLSTPTFPTSRLSSHPAAPAEYDGALNTRLEGGVAGDLITCRPFDRSLALFDAGHLASLNDLEGMANFGSVAKSAWVTDDGSDAFCVPMASVIHGFIYNKDIFDELGLSEPATVEEFYATFGCHSGWWLHSTRHGHGRPMGSSDNGLPEYRSQLLAR